MRKTITVAACVSALMLLAPAAIGRQAPTLKNIKVLTGLSFTEVDDAMMYIRGSLGVQCEHCHDEKDWSLDTKEEKKTARRMIQMVRDINRTLDDDLAVSCYTCHRGKLKPATTLPLLTERPTSAATVVKETPAAKALRADDIVKQYLEASGGSAWSRLRTRVVKGRLVTSEPAVYPAELQYQAPGSFRSRILVDGKPFTKIFDGTRGWSADNRGATEAEGPELERLKRQAVFALPVALPTFYGSLTVEGESTIAGARVFVLKSEARSPEPGARSPEPDRIFLSEASGLLVRIESTTVSPLGALPRRWDYEDYRKVDGVRVPFKIRETDPDYTYLWEFSSVRHNVPMDAALFKP
jgi:photosynthetic reaction center cytochrome c subunit